SSSPSSGTICATYDAPGPSRFGEGLDVALADARAEHLDPGPERRRPVALPAPPPDDVGAVLAGNRGQRFREPGLADAGLARDQAHPPPAADGFLQRRIERGE